MHTTQLKIGVEGIEIHAFHGVYPEEQEKGSLFVVDVSVETTAELSTDVLSHTLDYQKLYLLVLEVMQVRVQLLETLAQRICQRCLAQHPEVHSVQVRVAKKNPLGMPLCNQTFVEQRAVRGA